MTLAYTRPPDYPAFIALDTLNVCNARCPFCPLFVGEAQFDRQRRPAKVMDQGLFEKILTEVASWPQWPASIAFAANGETLQDPKILDRLLTLQRLGLGRTVTLLTNAQFLTGPVARAILDADIYQLMIGFDGATKSTYEAHRVRCNYEKVLQQIKEFVALRDAAGSKTRVLLKFVRTAQNQRELEDAYAMFRVILNPECDLFEDSLAIDWGDLPASDLGYYYHNKVKDLPRRSFCPTFDPSITIQPDGMVSACCWDYNLDVSRGGLGNIAEMTVLDAYRGKARSAFRDALAKGGDMVPAKCQSCITLHETDPVPEAEIRLGADRIILRTPTGFIYSLKEPALVSEPA